MEAPVHTTVGELIAILFDETRNLNWLKAHVQINRGSNIPASHRPLCLLSESPGA